MKMEFFLLLLLLHYNSVRNFFCILFRSLFSTISCFVCSFFIPVFSQFNQRTVAALQTRVLQTRTGTRIACYFLRLKTKHNRRKSSMKKKKRTTDDVGMCDENLKNEQMKPVFVSCHFSERADSIFKSETIAICINKFLVARQIHCSALQFVNVLSNQTSLDCSHFY